LAGGLSIGRGAHAAGSDVLKVGLIGCGGRGTGAAGNALTADSQAKLVAMGDAFEDRLMNSRKALKSQFEDRIDVPDDRCFVGFDAYQKVLASGVDVVVLAEPPHFRPQHLKAAIDAGKHVFCEKPVAVDAPGVRSVLATSEEAKKKNLSVVSGLCWRYDTAVKEAMQKVLDGSIGQLVNIEVVYNTGMLGGRDRKSDETEMQYQMRNWYCFTWLSGDHNVEQHVHSLDKALWAMHDEPPQRAWGLGGRQVRVDPRYGDIYDHHAVVYEYPNGLRVYSYCRQQNGCWGSVTDTFFGTKARCNVLGGPDTGFRVQSHDGKTLWRYKGPAAGSRMYVAEHEALFQAIRAGRPINNGVYMARSTMLAILGRMVDYTGKALTWEEAINSKQDLSPKSYAWDAEPPTKPDKDGRYPVATPGATAFT
jgi:predicted dehydrogenase